MDKNKEEIPKPIYIKDYSITFYGGKTGLGENNRAVIALYADSEKLIAWIKFYEDKEKIKEDMIDESNIITMNLPYSSYQNVLYTLRSNRPVQILFYQNVAMLIELKNEPKPPLNNSKKEKIN